jgi:hypothetical protein
LIKEMLTPWEKEFPGRSQTIIALMQNDISSCLLDSNLFDFKDIQLGVVAFDGVFFCYIICCISQGGRKDEIGNDSSTRRLQS